MESDGWDAAMVLGFGPTRPRFLMMLHPGFRQLSGLHPNLFRKGKRNLFKNNNMPKKSDKEDVLHQGMLEKRAAIKLLGWHARFFQMTQSKLLYFSGTTPPAPARVKVVQHKLTCFFYRAGRDSTGAVEAFRNHED